MSDPIKPGDLVVVTTACCDYSRKRGIGVFFTVGSVGPETHKGWDRCGCCGHPINWDMYVTAKTPVQNAQGGHPYIIGAPLPWLKKIDPPKSALVEHDIMRKLEGECVS